MKNVFVLIFLFIFTGFVMTNKEIRPEYHPSKGERHVHIILDKAAKIIREKYNLQPCGEGAAMPGGPIQKLALCFDTRFTHSKEQLRDLVIKSAHELLNQVREDQEIQGFLKSPPFNIKNVQIVIYNHDKNGRDALDPEISNAQILQGILFYASIDPEDSFKYKNEFEESYEEALRILSAQ